MVYIIYHDKCTDGFGAAWVAWQKFQDNATYIPLNHYDPIPQFKPNSQIYLLDFCFNRQDLVKLANMGHEITVLDHHQSAYNEVKDLIERPIKNLTLNFDLKKSGAEMAWEFFKPNETMPLLLEHIKDRDLGLFKLEKTQMVISVLMTIPKEFNLWNDLCVNKLFERGIIIDQVQNQLMEEMCEKSHWAQIGDFWVPVVNATAWWSDVTKVLLKKFPQAPFAAAYYALDDKRTKWSLRSLPNSGVNVAEISTIYGGGGHPNSGGFTSLTGEILFSNQEIKKAA
jgi:oligoribonuclease NrnB/cAMP/cGMP phosphodiesterase (DHH superfamily)